MGKSQLAAAFAHRALAEGVELVVWLDAAEAAEIVAGYATVALRVQAPGATGKDAALDARALLDWLAATERSWLVVLDDLTDPAAIDDWWPPPSPAGTGRVLATTRLRGGQLSGGGRTIIGIDTYTPDEACDYLRQRLTGAAQAHLLDDHVPALAEALGRLPLALGHAAAYMLNEELPCGRYLERFADHRTRMAQMLPREADAEAYGREVTAALLLALEAAELKEPKGLARPAIRLAAHLDPAGHPRNLWTQDAITSYLTAHRTPPPASPAESEPVTADQARAAVQLLHRYHLLDSDTRREPQAVRIHALTARAARETTPPADVHATVHAAADALNATWPAAEHTAPELATVLRTNTDTLTRYAGDRLRQPGIHPVLHRVGDSLSTAGLYAAAFTYRLSLAHHAERLLGPEHLDTLRARDNLAASYVRAGRVQEAILIGEQVVAGVERLLGPEHPHTMAARGNLAVSYRGAGRVQEAILVGEQVVADRVRLLGSEAPDTLTARANLAVSYR
ncbi:tetratricopeptide repeat protein, partial [Streptomyces aculeolatus]